MQWNTPDFEEINLSGEVTAYVNTDDDPAVVPPALSDAKSARSSARDESA